VALVKRGGNMATKPLRRWTTDELETAIYSGRLDNIQRYEAEHILSERERAPERSSYAGHTTLLLGRSRSRWAPLWLP
jgi:hypothetical protein